MTRIPVALFNDRTQAEPLLKRLIEAGHHPEIHDELHLERLWFVSKPEAGARLEVPTREYDQVCSLLREWDAGEGALLDAIRCPECKSFRVDYPQFTRKFLSPNLVGLIAETGLVEKDYYCEDCHYTWPKPSTRPERVRQHTAPYYFIEGIQPATSPQSQP
jgi:hypothetical protein